MNPLVFRTFQTLSGISALLSHPLANAAEMPESSRPQGGVVDFLKDVRPILEASCYECHGPKKQEASLRLDHKATALRKVILPGNADGSPLIHMITGRDGEFMPKRGPRLTGEQVAVLRSWIDAGAEWPESASVVLKEANRDHWAFRPPVRPMVPAGEVNAIDGFIRRKLGGEGLDFSPPADPVTLCRRIHLDLAGLPPSPAEVDAFAAAFRESPDAAVSALTERLLASPHYGERWGRHWLDAARYADSDGYEKDKPRVAHFYRDWVIGAFNRDLPYDQFIIEQLAGDLLPGATQDQRVATGFLRNSMINEEGGVDPEQFRMEAMFDRMEAIGKGVLGLTIQCAQCHDHKYDPISQAEYYRMFAFLNNDHESQQVVYTPAEQMARADLLRRITETEEMMKASAPGWEERMAAWEDGITSAPRAEWKVIQPVVEDITTGGQRYLPQPDGSFLCAGYQPTKHQVKMRVHTDLQGITAFRIDMMNDPDLPAGGPGRSAYGTFGITEFSVDAGREGKLAPVRFAAATADLEPAPETPVRPQFNEKTPVRRVIGPASYAIDGSNETAWSNEVGPVRRNRGCAITFMAERPVSNEGGTDLLIRIMQNHGGWNSDDLMANAMGRFRISITATAPGPLDALPEAVRDALAVPRGQRGAARRAEIFSHWRTLQPEWREMNAKLEGLWRQLPDGATQMTLTPRERPRDTRLLKRGDWLKPGDAVTPGVPSVLNPLPAGSPPTRLTFARWLTDTRAPTTARVAMNRMWQSYFGTGLVASAEDMGTQAEPPSHPELLDWLAVEFMERGWSQKAMHRLIICSRTYRQSSVVDGGLHAKDPYNRLLARGSRLRVEGEIVRDIALSASGLLADRQGGRSVMPPAPAFLFLAPVSYAPFPWLDEAGEDRYRRSVYTYRRRTSPHPVLQAFDVPEGAVSCVRRTRSNTPLQALAGLNETISMEAAQALARRMLNEGGATDAARLTHGFRLCVARAPTADELGELGGLLERQSGRFPAGADPNGVGGRGDVPPGTDAGRLAAYTLVSRVLLNLDETITRE